MENTQNYTGKEKPIKLRIIFILNALKILISLGFYLAFTFTEFRVGDIDPSLILYTFIGYVLLFAAMVTSILKRNIWGLRISIFLDFLVSIPAKAFIGFAIAAISIALTFTKTVQLYFKYKASANEKLNPDAVPA